MSLNLLTILYSAGIVQTVILAVMLLKKVMLQSRANKLMLALLASILVVLVQYMLVVNGYRGRLPVIAVLSTMSWFAIGPLLYLYALAKSTSSFRFKRVHLLFFAFPAYNLLHYPLYASGLRWGFYMLFDNIVVYSYSWLFAYLVHSLIFGLLALLHLRKHGKEKDQWLLQFFYLLLGVLSLYSIYLAIKVNPVRYHNELERYLVLVFDAFVLMLTFRSLNSSRLFQDETAGIKYSNSALSVQQLDLSHQRLLEVMSNEKPYLDRKLSLKELSAISEIKENQLSQIFSQHLGSSFYDFINAYRLSEVEERLADPRYAHLKIAGLAEDCGFNSKAVFYKAFKEKHGLSPTQYLNRLKS